MIMFDDGRSAVSVIDFKDGLKFEGLDDDFVSFESVVFV